MGTYRKEGKQEAYEAAQKLAGLMTHIDECTLMVIESHSAVKLPGLSDDDVRQVAAKAIRVERGRRLGKGPTTHQMPLRLNESDRRKLTAIADEHGVSDAEAVRIAIRASAL